MKLTQADCRTQIKRLSTVFALPRGKDVEEVAKGWLWVMGSDVAKPDLMAAVSTYAKTGGRYWPTASQIRELALDHARTMGRVQEPTRNGPDPALECATCGEKLRVLKGDELSQGVYDIEQDVRAFGILHVPPCPPGRVS